MGCGQGQELSPHLTVQSIPNVTPEQGSSSIRRPTHLERLLEVAERVTQQLDTALSESGVKQPRLAGKRSRTLMERH